MRGEHLREGTVHVLRCLYGVVDGKRIAERIVLFAAVMLSMSQNDRQIAEIAELAHAIIMRVVSCSTRTPS